MNELEQKVWAAAYAPVFANELAFFKTHGQSEKVCGQEAADWADVAVRKLRETLAGPDAYYLCPVAEKWK